MLRVYLDTSVLSALHDADWPERQELTRAFWARRGEFEVSTSEVGRREVDRTPDLSLRALMQQSLAEINILPVTPEMRGLAQTYINAGIFTPRQGGDALHVASAVLTRQDVLASWNFKHLVNRRRHAEVISVNLMHGLPRVEIVSPPEI